MTSQRDSSRAVVRIVAAALVCANTALFLVLAWFHQLSSQGKGLVFVDFWGRLTVYSLWFMVYEAYRKYMDGAAACGDRPGVDRS